MNPILAIDPGASGGFAWGTVGFGVQCRAMPDTEGDVLDQLREISACAVHRVIMEDQIGCVGPGFKVSSTAMFTFGRGFGFLLGSLMALGFQIELVRPQKWQAALSLGKKKDHGNDWKRHLKAEAQRLFPNCDVTLKTADALLLLHYASGKVPF